MSISIEDKRPSLGAVASVDAAQYDEDDVLDGWLASLTPDQLACVFDGLASVRDGQLSSLESTA